LIRTNYTLTHVYTSRHIRHPPSTVFQEFVNLALNSIHGEKVAPKVYQKAGSTLNIEPESLQKAVVALAASLLEAAKKNANEKEFVASSYDLTLSSENQAILIKVGGVVQ